MKNIIVDELYDEKLKRDKIVNQFKRKCACGYNISLMKNGRLLKYKTCRNCGRLVYIDDKTKFMCEMETKLKIRGKKK